MNHEYYNEKALDMCDRVFKDMMDRGVIVRVVDNEQAYGNIVKRYMHDKGESKCVSNAMDAVAQAMYTGEEFARRVNVLYEAALGQAAASLELAVVARMIYEQDMLYPGRAGVTPIEALVEEARELGEAIEDLNDENT